MPLLISKIVMAEASWSYHEPFGFHSLQYTAIGSAPVRNRAASKVWIAMSSSRTCSMRSRNPPKCAPMKKSLYKVVRSPSSPSAISLRNARICGVKRRFCITA